MTNVTKIMICPIIDLTDKIKRELKGKLNLYRYGTFEISILNTTLTVTVNNNVILTINTINFSDNGSVGIELSYTDGSEYLSPLEHALSDSVGHSSGLEANIIYLATRSTALLRREILTSIKGNYYYDILTALESQTGSNQIKHPIPDEGISLSTYQKMLYIALSLHNSLQAYKICKDIPIASLQGFSGDKLC